MAFANDWLTATYGWRSSNGAHVMRGPTRPLDNRYGFCEASTRLFRVPNPRRDEGTIVRPWGTSRNRSSCAGTGRSDRLRRHPSGGQHIPSNCPGCSTRVVPSGHSSVGGVSHPPVSLGTWPSGHSHPSPSEGTLPSGHSSVGGVSHPPVSSETLPSGHSHPSPSEGTLPSGHSSVGGVVGQVWSAGMVLRSGHSWWAGLLGRVGRRGWC